MSIDATLTNILPMAETGIACQIAAPALATVGAGTPQEFCFCEYECEYLEPVFALEFGTAFQNDKSAFARARVLPADSIVFELYKNDVLFATIIDNTYGTYTDFGGHLTQLDVKSFEIDWNLVFLAIGGGTGRYQFKSIETIVGIAQTFESRSFRLEEFSPEVADKTVRIETIQNGSINGGETEFNFTGMQWASSFRIYGTISSRKPTLEDDAYLNSQRQRTQITTKIINTYTLSTELIPRTVINLLFDTVLSNDIFVTGYSLFSTNMKTQGKSFEYSRINMHPESIDEPREFNRSQKELYVINFLDKAELPLKRNFE